MFESERNSSISSIGCLDSRVEHASFQLYFEINGLHQRHYNDHEAATDARADHQQAVRKADEHLSEKLTNIWLLILLTRL